MGRQRCSAGDQGDPWRTEALVIWGYRGCGLVARIPIASIGSSTLSSTGQRRGTSVLGRLIIQASQIRGSGDAIVFAAGPACV